MYTSFNTRNRVMHANKYLILKMKSNRSNYARALTKTITSEQTQILHKSKFLGLFNPNLGKFNLYFPKF